MSIYFKIRNIIVSHIMRRPKLWLKVVIFFRNTFLISVIGIVKDNQNRILILKHTYRPDPWALPSGWLHKGETPLQTIIREVKEETGFDINATKILFMGTSSTSNHLEFFVECNFIEGSFKPSNEVIDYKWIDENPNIPLLQGFFSILKKNSEKPPNDIGYYEVNWQ